jgi:hypothetical protein
MPFLIFAIIGAFGQYKGNEFYSISQAVTPKTCQYWHVLGEMAIKIGNSHNKVKL